MDSSDVVFIGIDLSGPRRTISCAVLNPARRILFNGSLTPLEWQSLLASYPAIVAAVNAPLTLNEGYMADADYRQKLTPVPNGLRYTDMRVCDYGLICEGLSVARVPKSVGKFSASLQRSLKFTSELGINGFQYWPTPIARLQMLETHAEGAFWSLLGVKPFPQNSLEGRIQRQLVLQSKGVPVKDAMAFFEEVTRHRFLTGSLPVESILSPIALNCLISAYTAWSVVNRPAEFLRLGEEEEGFIFLPEIPKK